MAAFDQPWAVKKETEWSELGKITGVEKHSKFCVLHLENMVTDLTVTFPKDGGIRIYSEYQGFFFPKELATIEYDAENGEDILTSSSGETLRIDTTNNRICFVTCKHMPVKISLSDSSWGMKDGKITQAKLGMPYDKEEVFYGFGERFNDFNQNGNDLDLWNIDTIYHVYPAEGEKLESYKNVPIYHSSKGYSLFYNSFYNCNVHFGDTVTFAFDGPEFDVYIWTGTPVENLEHYLELTGKPILPPRWAFRYWAGAGASVWQRNGSDEASVLATVQEVFDKYRELGIGLPVLYTEYPTPFIEETYRKAEANGTKILMWIRPSLNRREMQEKLPDVTKAELPVVESLDWLRVKDNIDFTSPYAKELIKQIYAQNWEWGLKGSMIDFGEYWSERSFYQSGMPGNAMHNMSTYYYNKVVYDAWHEQMGDDYITFSRSGCAGSQHWSACFGGDQASTWFGLEQSLYGMLSLAASGFSTWGSDLGGFFGNTKPEIYCRWLQFSTFSPLMRAHGIIINKDPWNFGEEACRQFQTYYEIRERLLDTIYSAAIEASETGRTMVKPLAMAYPFDEKCQAVNDEYVFCNSFLVAPVVYEDVRERAVYLPKGEWVDFWTGEVLTGEQTVQRKVPLEQIPVFLAQNSLLRVAVDTKSEQISDTTGQKKKVLLITKHTGRKVHTVYEENQTFIYEVDYDGMTLTVKGDTELDIVTAGFTPEKIVKEKKEVQENV